jgi:hypothetical protein
MFHASSKRVLAGFAASAATCLGLLSIAAPASGDVKPEGGSTSSPAPIADPESGLDTTSVALGALGGIALGGAGLGITLGMQRRRDHAAAQHA